MSASEEQILEALPMVRCMASHYAYTPLGAQDALGVGAVALVEAARRYDPGRGVPFAGFARSRVKGAMCDAYRPHKGSNGGRPGTEVPCDPETIGLTVCDPVAARPDGHLDLLAAIARLRRRLRRVVVQHARGVPHREIAEDLGVTESRVSQLLATARRRLRLETETSSV